MILFQSVFKRMLSISDLNLEVKSAEIHSLNDAEQCLEKENQQSGNECGRAVSS